MFQEVIAGISNLVCCNKFIQDTHFIHRSTFYHGLLGYVREYSESS